MVEKRDFKQELIQKAIQDADFKKNLKANPKETIQTEFGITLPEDLSIEVLEELPNKKFLVLPEVQEDNTELSDEELAKVAGGEKEAPWGEDV